MTCRRRGEGDVSHLRSERSLTLNFVTTFYPPYNFGGDGIFIYRLANALAERGHYVDVVHCADAYQYLAGRPPQGEFPNHSNVRVHTLRSGLGLLSPIATYSTGVPLFKMSALREILDRPADVTHFHNVSLVGGPGILSYGRGVKLYTTHEHWLVCPTHVLLKRGVEPCDEPECLRCQVALGRPPQPWRYTPLLRHKLKHLDALLAPSDFTLRRHAGLGVRCELLPHFVPAPTPPSDDASPHDRPYVLYAGRLEMLKGILWLLEVFKMYRSVDLVVAGDGTDGERARAMAADLPHVRFAGRLDHGQLDHYYRRALATIVPSLCYETFGLVAAEALATGCPVIVRDLGSLPEIVHQSDAGFVFSRPDELIAAIERLRQEPGLREVLGRQGVAAYQQHWTEERHVGRYLALVDELTRTATRPTSGVPQGSSGGAL
jgi:glycosyltransferase involved in cell wall biosynthesis